MYVFLNSLADNYEAEAGHGLALGNLTDDELKVYKEHMAETHNKHAILKPGWAWDRTPMYSAGEGYEWETHSIFESLIDKFVKTYHDKSVEDFKPDEDIDKRFFYEIDKESYTTKRAKLEASNLGKLFPKLTKSIAKHLYTRDPSKNANNNHKH